MRYLEAIGERFGTETVEDCLMAVSAYVTHSLHSDYAIFHWTDASLPAITWAGGDVKGPADVRADSH